MEGAPPNVPDTFREDYPALLRLHRKCIAADPTDRPDWPFIMYELALGLFLPTI